MRSVLLITVTAVCLLLVSTAVSGDEPKAEEKEKEITGYSSVDLGMKVSGLEDLGYQDSSQVSPYHFFIKLDDTLQVDRVKYHTMVGATAIGEEVDTIVVTIKDLDTIKKAKDCYAALSKLILNKYDESLVIYNLKDDPPGLTLLMMKDVNDNYLWLAITYVDQPSSPSALATVMLYYATKAGAIRQFGDNLPGGAENKI